MDSIISAVNHVYFLIPEKKKQTLMLPFPFKDIYNLNIWNLIGS